MTNEQLNPIENKEIGDLTKITTDILSLKSLKVFLKNTSSRGVEFQKTVLKEVFNIKEE